MDWGTSYIHLDGFPAPEIAIFLFTLGIWKAVELIRKLLP